MARHHNRLRARLLALLERGCMSTLELRDEINQSTKHGTTSSELVNLLSKDPIFRKVGKVRIPAAGGYAVGSYLVSRWGLAGVEG